MSQKPYQFPPINLNSFRVKVIPCTSSRKDTFARRQPEHMSSLFMVRERGGDKYVHAVAKSFPVPRTTTYYVKRPKALPSNQVTRCPLPPLWILHTSLVTKYFYIYTRHIRVLSIVNTQTTFATWPADLNPLDLSPHRSTSITMPQKRICISVAQGE